MISADLHLHTSFSHGSDSPLEMYMQACKKGLQIMGFSEHSPRPEGYNYTHEYRKHLAAGFPDYIRQVTKLKQLPQKPRALLGLEMDWLPAEMDFVVRAISAHDYDYLIGSVHFLDQWGFDDGSEPWLEASQEECERLYEQYFMTWRSMLQSGLFQIAAHPDLIKIFSVDRFHIWIEKPQSRQILKSCLTALRDSGMAMEISSAGLRKACAEIYPCPQIMTLAAGLGLEISFASDAHCARDIAHEFATLADYAGNFGFSRHVVFEHGKILHLPF